MKLSFRKKSSGDGGGEDTADALPKSAKSAKSFKSKATRFVLLIGDEGAILIHIKNGVVVSRQFVPDSSQPSLNDLRTTIEQDPGAPVLLTVDTMDQTYVQQTLPPVSSLSVGKLIKRRLERDFGENTVKGAVMLGREKTGRKDWHFVMVALEKSPQFMAWVDFVRGLPNRFEGIYVAAVEAELLVKAIDRGMGIATKPGSGSKWKFLVSHNKVGGFRQVMFQNGRIVFTRLAQPIGGASSPEVIAGSIEQEMLSTIEYMKRLSFSSQEGLDIYIIAAAGVKSALDQSKFSANNLHILTPHEAAEYTGMQGASQPSDQFGDVLMAATVGYSTKHALGLTIPYIEQINGYLKLRLGVRAAAALIAACLLLYAGWLGYDIFSLSSADADLNQEKQAKQQSLAALKEEVARSELDVDQADDQIDLYKQMGKEVLSPAVFLKRFAGMRSQPVDITSLSWGLKTAKPDGAPPAPGSEAPPPPPGAAPSGTGPAVEAAFGMSFPIDTASPLAFPPFAEKILNAVKELYPGYTVKYASIPPEFQQRDSLELDFDKNNAARTVEPPKVEVSITGPAIPSDPAAPPAQKAPVTP